MPLELISLPFVAWVWVLFYFILFDFVCVCMCVCVLEKVRVHRGRCGDLAYSSHSSLQVWALPFPTPPPHHHCGAFITQDERTLTQHHSKAMVYIQVRAVFYGLQKKSQNFFLFWQSCYVALGGQELTVQTRIVLNLECSFCFCFAVILAPNTTPWSGCSMVSSSFTTEWLLKVLSSQSLWYSSH